MSFDSKKSATSTQKPAYSYAELIAQAIISVPTYKLPLNKIYEWISTNYPFYKLSETGWQNSIRHNLSLNNSFCKVQRTEDDPGKGCYWTIVKDQRQKFENLLSKKVGAKITAVINKRTNPKKRYNAFSDSESDLSESEYEDEEDMLYKDKIIIRPKKMRKIENSDDMAYTEKNKYNKNKKNKKLVKVSRKSSTTQVPASPTPSPILTKRESNFSENKKFDEVEEESDSMIMEETSEDEYENYPPSPQSPDLPPIHTHKNYDFTFDLFPESPRLEEDDEEVEEEEEIKLNNTENEEVEVANSEDEEEEVVEEEEEYEDYENEDFEFEGENQDPLPTIKISKSAVSLFDDMQNQTQNQEELSTENQTTTEMIASVPVQKETLLHDKDDDVNVLEKYKNTYLSDYHGIDHNYNCYINDELDKQYNYYLHSPIFNSLTCPELADMCFGVNLNTLDYSSLNEDYQNIPDKLDFVDMGVENWWRDETNNYPIYG